MGTLQVTQAGTFNWAAPELILNHEVTSAADIYSFGIICYEIITGEVPSRGVVSVDKCVAVVWHCLVTKRHLHTTG